MSEGAEVIVIGAGLAGLVATAGIGRTPGGGSPSSNRSPAPGWAGKPSGRWRPLLVNSPEQRRLGVRDSHERALRDWMVTGRIRSTGRPVAASVGRTYLAFAAGKTVLAAIEGHPVLSDRWLGGARWLHPRGPGNSVPRFHVTWGYGPGVVAPFERRVREAAARGLVTVKSAIASDADGSGGSVDGSTEPSSNRAQWIGAGDSQVLLRIRAQGASGDRDLGWARRKSRVVRTNWP